MAEDTDNDEAPAIEAIERQLGAQGVRTDKDVEELYLARLGLSAVPALDVFRNLKVLRLNANRLRTTGFLRSCERLTELYLQDNMIASVAGTLAHLSMLRRLSLARNQLTGLEAAVAELKRMQFLERLSLAENPIAQEADYRHYVVHHCPAVALLDRQEVTPLQRRTARRAYDQDAELVRDRVAFGRRSEGPPHICHPPVPPTAATPPAEQVGNSFFRDNPPLASAEAAAEARRLKKSLVEYTRFDWARIPRYEARRTRPAQEVQPELVTVRLKI